MITTLQHPRLEVRVRRLTIAGIGAVLLVGLVTSPEEPPAPAGSQR